MSVDAIKTGDEKSKFYFLKFDALLGFYSSSALPTKNLAIDIWKEKDYYMQTSSLVN